VTQTTFPSNRPTASSRCLKGAGYRIIPSIVIASEAKQSRASEPQADRDCFVAFGSSQ
jgi:hypothetical protein